MEDDSLMEGYNVVEGSRRTEPIRRGSILLGLLARKPHSGQETDSSVEHRNSLIPRVNWVMARHKVSLLGLRRQAPEGS
jgi:hypothetical protein